MSLVNTTVLMSPSYPKYYLAVSGGCGWRVRLPPHQSLLVRVLDLQLRAARDDLADHCQDSLLIDNRVNICGELHSELHYVSKANSVLIQFRIGPDRQYIYPLRGFLVQLIPVGCSVPPSLSQAQLSHYNSTHAQYRCRDDGRVFSDSLLATSFLLCIGQTWGQVWGQTYERPLPPCVRLERLLASGNVTTVTRLKSIYSNLSTVLSVQSDSVISPIIWIQEVITPIMISLSGLVLGIAALILVLLVKHYRQYRHEPQPPPHFHPHHHPHHHQHHQHLQPAGNIFF